MATASAMSSSSSRRLDSLSWEERVQILREHFQLKGYRVHSGLQFGCELVLYADEPGKVHSDFCVHLVGSDERLDWRAMQTLVRSMPDLHKTLILAYIDETKPGQFQVEEIAMATEHAPFRHRKVMKEVGAQVKRQKT
mmetsp:Transcript_18078/g.30819  ORF Transcript_18078/g.30819 Transcript_18078/m.30819 type:complete len:138 (-) Transcript_18078:314-727(-)|eukprot:CAMPEP_0116544874 /NCGR_PEP_ID=MMETSP0397-20121206/2352_1 /TAXON_ID=216820 /ORGANISM="Cyclophora tenuis, Strain ECT3854" /LENGTH=137 /DNA_ID=CAMNT_0004069119 /DNA_START=255 /DNA_END=668 /DNA_ORIENTATION=-